MSENLENKGVKRFKTLTDEDKQKILDKRKSQNTNNATRLWINALKDYITEKGYPPLEDLSIDLLDEAIGNFYVEARKKNFAEIDPNDPDDEERKTNYKNTSLRAARAAFTRYFKESRKINIVSDPAFTKSNGLFLGKTKDNKEKGLGKVDNKPPINDQDMEKLGINLRNQSNPTPKCVQQIKKEKCVKH